MDPQGNHIGFMAEPLGNLGTHLTRQFFTTHRSFTAHIFDKYEREVLRIQRPFSWINSRIRVHDPVVAASSSNNSRSYQDIVEDGRAGQISTLPLSDMRVIGEAQQQWAPLRRKYNLFLYHDSPNMATNTKGISGGEGLSESQQLQVAEGGRGPGEFSQFAYVDEPFLSWDFSLMTADSNLLGSVNRNFQGFGREILTDTGVYALRMDAAGLADEPRHLISQTGRSSQSAYDNKTMGMTLDQRAVMLATAVSIDFDYFSRKSGGGGFGFLPWLWFPEATAGGATVGAAGEAGAATGAAGEAGTSAATTAAGRAASGIARGAGGIGEGAAVGAGTMAGYEAMQRGLYGESAQQPPPNEQTPPPPQEQTGEEDIWGTGSKDPWSGGGDGGSTGGDLGGGGADWF
jgi:Scramblase